MPHYYGETNYGCGIREAQSLKHAERIFLSEVGSYGNVRNIRLATNNDMNWVFAMSGNPTSVSKGE